MYANVRNASSRRGDSIRRAISSFSRSMRATIAPIGSSTSGIQSSSTSAIAPGLWLFAPRAPCNLGGGQDQDAGEQLAQRCLGDALGDLRAPDRGPDRGDADDERGAPADVAVAL